MKHKYFVWALMAAFCMGGALTSCTDDDEGTNGNPPSIGTKRMSLPPRWTTPAIWSFPSRSTKGA